MSADRYTRAVLTIIAGCLLYLCFILTPGTTVHAVAEPIPMDVYIKGFKVVDTKGTVAALTIPKGMQGVPVHLMGAASSAKVTTVPGTR